MTVAFQDCESDRPLHNSAIHHSIQSRTPYHNNLPLQPESPGSASDSRNDLVLITGASGCIATHILSEFLQAGYRVRGTVRNEDSAAKVRKNFPSYSNARLSFVFVPDVAADQAFDKAVAGVDGVVHTAAPVFYGSSVFDEKLLEPAILGTKGLLESIQQHGSDVKQVVITASFSCVVDSTKGLNPHHTYTEKDWNPIDVSLAKENPRLMYTLSKTLAKKAAWDWYHKHNPPFQLSTICPPMIFGPVLGSTTLKTLNQSAADIWNLMSGEAKEVPPTHMPAFVDVRDAAQTHLRAYSHQKGGRFIPCGGRYMFRDVCAILARRIPEYADRIPKAKHEDTKVDTYVIDNDWTKKELDQSFRGLEECIVDMGRSLAELERASSLAGKH